MDDDFKLPASMECDDVWTFEKEQSLYSFQDRRNTCWKKLLVHLKKSQRSQGKNPGSGTPIDYQVMRRNK